MWNPKYDTNESICETDSQIWRIDLWLPRGESGAGEGWIGSWELADANYYIYREREGERGEKEREWINNMVLLCSTGNTIQYPVINHHGKEYIYIYTHTHTYIYISIYIYIYES